jgi:hypothetical protein
MQLLQELNDEGEEPKLICGRELKKLQKHLLPIDRKKAVATFDINYVTISRYVNGKVGNLALGIRLLNFFKKRINKRANELKKLCKNQEN